MQSHSTTSTVIELDPKTTLNDVKYKYYWQFLLKEAHLSANEIYDLAENDSLGNPTSRIIKVKVTKDLVRYYNKQGEPRFLILGDQIGKGSYAAVHLGLAKIKLSSLDGSMIYKDYEGKPKYAIKKQAHHQSHPPRKAIDEANILSKLIDLRGKKAVFSHDQHYSFLIQRYISGKDLQRFITEDSKQPSFATDDRLRLSRLLLKIQGQVINANFVHCDMRPENILFDPSKWGAVIIDVGLSRAIEKAKNTKVFIGTPMFGAPEVWRREGLTHFSDLFGVGVMLFQLWNKDPLIVERVLNDFETALSSLNVFIKNALHRTDQLAVAYDTVCADVMATSAETDDKLKLLDKIYKLYKPTREFDGIRCGKELLDDLTELSYAGMEARASRYNEERITIQHDLTREQTTILKFILECTTCPNPQLRSIETGMKRIETILFERKLASKDAASRSTLTRAFNQAIKLRELIEKNNTNLLCYMKILDFDAIRSHVNEALIDVEESKDSVNQFVETLEIAAVSHADHDTKEQVKNRIESLIELFISRIIQFAALQKEFEASASNNSLSPLGVEILRRISSILASYDKFTFTFDGMVFISDGLAKEYAKLEPLVAQYKQSQINSQQIVASNSMFAPPLVSGQSVSTSSSENDATKTSPSVLGQKRKYSQ